MKVDCDDRAAHGGASVIRDDKVVGTVTSGEWGHRTNLNLAMAFIDTGFADEGTRLHIDMLGEIFDAEIITSSPYDPTFERVKI